MSRQTPDGGHQRDYDIRNAESDPAIRQFFQPIYPRTRAQAEMEGRAAIELEHRVTDHQRRTEREQAEKAARVAAAGKQWAAEIHQLRAETRAAEDEP